MRRWRPLAPQHLKLERLCLCWKRCCVEVCVSLSPNKNWFIGKRNCTVVARIRNAVHSRKKTSASYTKSRGKGSVLVCFDPCNRNRRLQSVMWSVCRPGLGAMATKHVANRLAVRPTAADAVKTGLIAKPRHIARLIPARVIAPRQSAVAIRAAAAVPVEAPGFRRRAGCVAISKETFTHDGGLAMLEAGSAVVVRNC